MTKKIAGIALLVSFSFMAMAQNTPAPKKTSRPDIPGTFALELGLNRLTAKPNNLKYGFWGSRTLNLYYQYDMRIGKSKFSFHPGIGFGMERFKLQRFDMPYRRADGSNVLVTQDNPTLGYDNEGNSVFIPAVNYIYDDDSLSQINWSGSFSTKKSMMMMNYLDIPVELRFSTRPDDPARSFKIGIGGRVGYLINAQTKIRYSENGEIKKLKNEQDFNLSRLRYSAFLKVYIGNFSLFSYYNFNPLFEENRGPGRTDASSYTVGISLSSF